MEGKPVFTPIDTCMLSYEEKRMALDMVNLIKEKRNGKIKGRTCADGSKQKNLKGVEIISSSMVYLEAILFTLNADSYEGLYVATL